MSDHKRIKHIAASAARTFHLWPLIARSGAFNRARRRRYPDTIVHLDVVITECCSLRCRDCSNLMQYYQRPQNLDPEQVITSLRNLLNAVKVDQMKILGGEPFVCQDSLIRILDYLRNEAGDRVGKIDIITNGTIIPSDECIRAMQDNPKVKVIFSNYGELSSKLEESADILRHKGISYDIIEDLFWWDFGDLKERCEKDKTTQHRFDGCYSRRLCTTLYRGRLYVCPRQAHAVNLGVIEDDETGTVDLSGVAARDPSALHDAVYHLIDRKEHITACRYCGCDAGVKVPRAVQAERPLDVS